MLARGRQNANSLGVMSLSDRQSRVTAVLGPTNTGKTHLAIERMLGHRSGMIGFPLRLLARENYDRVVKLKGAAAAALVTGEERVIPPGARYFVCTVESMPVDRPVEFLAVDEIQLASDPDRGHVFTDRLLHARGMSETMVMGADTMRPLLSRLLPGTEFIARPRFSSLAYAAPKKLGKLPRRSALVAFSASEVYALAEQMRRIHGGCAVVLGALSPRARNAQVAMYQSGEVDFMVATDAIGMGLNMDLDHVAFAKLSKFDGRAPRRLTPSEMAQIAGRAGRHMRDGTFGTTHDQGGLDPELVEAIETHRFDPLTAVYWRNPELDFRSIRNLLRSLDDGAPVRALKRKGDADDHQALLALSRNEEVAGKATSPAMVRLLWEICQVPDFRKTMTDSHPRLLAQLFGHLAQPRGRLPTDWVAGQITRLDRADGDIDQLSQRLAHIRTWTYVSNRGDWLVDPAHWQERTRAIEDRLSDALHERLTQRFVDRRGALLARKLESSDQLLAGVRRDGTVIVEGHVVGRLDGLIFRADQAAGVVEARTLISAARRALADEIERRIRAIQDAADADFAVTESGVITWTGSPIGRLAPGPSRLAPVIDPVESDLVSPPARERIRRRVLAFLRGHVDGLLRPLIALRDAPLAGPARGIAFQLVEGLGSVPRADLDSQIAALTPEDRAALTRLGCRFGTESVYLVALLNRRPQRLRAMLHAVRLDLRPIPILPKAKTIPRRDDIPVSWYDAAGYRVFGGYALRIDLLETIAQSARRLARRSPFMPPPDLLALAGLSLGEIGPVLEELGYRGRVTEAGTLYAARRRKPAAPRETVADPVPPDSPFAALRARLAARS